MLTVAETYDRLGPRVRDLATFLHKDPDVTAVGACVRLQGVDHEVRVEQAGPRALKLSVRVGRFSFYRGRLSDWYAAVDRAGRDSRRARRAA